MKNIIHLNEKGFHICKHEARWKQHNIFQFWKKRSGDSESHETDNRIVGANHRSEMDLDLTHISHIQIEPTYPMYKLNSRNKRQKRKSLGSHGRQRNSSFGTKQTIYKINKHKLDFIKIKTFALHKTLLNIQKTSTDWEKVFSNHMYSITKQLSQNA